MSKITKDDLLSLVKKVRLVLTAIEDDKSVDRNGNEVVNKILHLAEPVQASSSTGAGQLGTPITIKDNKLWMNERELDTFIADCRKEGEYIIYEGGLHLDVARPKMDRNTNQVRTPARIWLTGIKFNKLGTQTRNEATKTYNTLIADMFGAGKVVDMTAAATPTATPPPTGNQPPKDEKSDDVDPKVVANKNGAGTGAKTADATKEGAK